MSKTSIETVKITKECPICGSLFSTNIFSEEDICAKCKAVCKVIPPVEEYDSDARAIIEGIVSPYGRAVVHRYD